jgi:hypothetical protein
MLALSSAAVHGLVPPVVSVFGSAAGVGDAGGRAMESALGDVPLARGLVLAVLARGPGPGLRPHADTVRACVQAVRHRGIPLRGAGLGRTDAALAAIFASERVPPVEDREPLRCAWPGLGRTVVIPRGWIGRHLALVVPCVGANAPRRGPVAAALAALADEIGVGDVAGPCAAAASVIAGVFAGVTILVDGDVAVVRARSGGARARLVPTQRIFTAHRVPAPASWLLALARGFDGWLQARAPTTDLKFAGPCADTPWSAAVGEPLDGNGAPWAPPVPRRRAVARALAR